MKIVDQSSKTVRVFLLFLLVLSIVCQGKIISAETVPPEKRITVKEGGPHSGTWDSVDVKLSYQYAVESGEGSSAVKFRISGTASAKMRFKIWKVWVQCLDADGKVLEQKLLASRVYHAGIAGNVYYSRMASESFEHAFEILPGMASISFRSYLEHRDGHR